MSYWNYRVIEKHYEETDTNAYHIHFASSFPLSQLWNDQSLVNPIVIFLELIDAD